MLGEFADVYDALHTRGYRIGDIEDLEFWQAAVALGITDAAERSLTGAELLAARVAAAEGGTAPPAPAAATHPVAGRAAQMQAALAAQRGTR